MHSLNKLLSGNEDGAVIATDFEQEWTLAEQTSPVICLVDYTDLIVSGNQAGRITLYNPKNNNPPNSFQAHANAVLCLEKYSCGLISGCADGCIRVWTNTGNLIQTIGNAHKDGVLCLCVDQDMVLSAGADGVIKVWVWNMSHLEHSATMSEHVGPIWCMQKSLCQLRTAGLDEKIITWDFEAFQSPTVVPPAA